MASQCVSAISDLNPEIAARGETEGCYGWCMCGIIRFIVFLGCFLHVFSFLFPFVNNSSSPTSLPIFRFTT